MTAGIGEHQCVLPGAYLRFKLKAVAGRADPITHMRDGTIQIEPAATVKLYRWILRLIARTSFGNGVWAAKCAYKSRWVTTQRKKMSIW